MKLKRRRASLLEVYKRVVEVLRKDPDLTYSQVRERFGIGSTKLAELRKEALETKEEE